MREIDWSKAPEGAQYYCVDNRLFYKFDGAGRGQCTSRGARWASCGDRGDYEPGELTPRPSSPAWNGEGLPPVGTVCEVRWGSKDWSRCTVFAHKPNANGTTDALIDLDGDWTFFDKPSMFRPIRTPAQIAAEEREKAVDAMCYEIIMHYGYPKNAEAYRALATKLHDAGYRKTEG